MPSARFRRRLRRFVVLLVLVVLVVGGVIVAGNHLQQNQALVRERCTAAVGTDTYQLAPDQAASAALIAGLAVQRSLPPQAAAIALATAIQESKLRNIDYGDRDSVGLFQQRPSQGWGSQQDILDPVYATNAFYDALVQIEGYEQLAVTDAAQQVQRSAFPDAYADHEEEARAFALALTGQSPGGLTCTLRRPEAVGQPADITARMVATFGELRTNTVDGAVTVGANDTQGWAVAHWAIAHAKELNVTAVSFAGLRWSRDAGAWSVVQTQPGQVRIAMAGPDEIG